MSLSLQARQVSFLNSPPVRREGKLCFAVVAVTPSRRKPRLFSQSLPTLVRDVSSTRSHFEILLDWRANASSLGSYESSSSSSSSSAGFDFDSFLSFSELLFIVFSTVTSAVIAVNYVIFGEIRKRILSWGFVGLVCAVAIGSWLRRRQWNRICRGMREGEGSNLLPRIEKLEEDVRSSATTVRILSRQLEKLGIRFRITRQALKEPISETAALVQKNSEATRVLAAQEDILEKELVEIQKVLLAMQEQQQKQLELILAATKNGKLLESNNKQASESDEQRGKGNEYFHSSSDEFVNKDSLSMRATGTNT